MTPTAPKTKSRYFEAVGRRKTAVARVRFEEAPKQSLVVNDSDLATYFPTEELQTIASSPLSAFTTPVKFKVSVKVKGGGIAAQAGAVRHGLSRGLILFDQTLRKTLKPLGYLKRDPRMKERRKFGLKKARKAAQWSKR